MPTSDETDNIQKDIETLIATQYTLPPKEFAHEEVAVKQTLEKLLHVLQQPESQQSMLSTISTESIENMTKRGQLTLVAEHLDNTFLNSVENVLKKSKVVFEKDGKKVVLADLYKDCKEELTDEKGREPSFGDVLLRMYTEDGPFFKKLNAIVGGYNDPDSTTNEEKQLALLLNVAIHKAGLEKRKYEVHETPEYLYRGQSFGLKNFEQKFEKVKELHEQGKLSSLSPEALAEVNIVDIAAKKVLSTSPNAKITSQFATAKGVVLHLKNPELLADFYNVANISKFAHESEFITRIPDDVAMIPVSITKDSKGVSHIEVVCIRSENVLLHNSTRMHDIRESLKGFIKNELDYDDSFLASFSPDWFDEKQRSLMKMLLNMVDKSNQIKLVDNTAQDDFLETAFLTLRELYKTNPTSTQKQTFDHINKMLEEYAAVIADVKVTHPEYHSREIIDQEQTKIITNLQGKRMWLNAISGTGDELLISPIRDDLNQLLNGYATLTEIREAASNILTTLKDQEVLNNKFPALEEGLNEIIASVDKVRTHQEFLPENQVKTAPSVNLKAQLQQSKTPSVNANPQPAATTEENEKEQKGYGGSI